MLEWVPTHELLDEDGGCTGELVMERHGVFYCQGIWEQGGRPDTPADLEELGWTVTPLKERAA